MTLTSRSCPTCHSIGDPRTVDRTLGSNEPILCRNPWHDQDAQPERDVTDDLRTLAAMQRAAFDAAFPGLPPGLSPEEARRRINAALAAVLPDHHRQVLAEAARRYFGLVADVEQLTEWLAAHGLPMATAAGQAVWAVARDLQELAATVPETGPSGRVAAEIGPAVPEATPHVRETPWGSGWPTIRIDESLPPDTVLLVPPRQHDETADEHTRRAAAIVGLGTDPTPTTSDIPRRNTP